MPTGSSSNRITHLAVLGQNGEERTIEGALPEGTFRIRYDHPRSPDDYWVADVMRDCRLSYPEVMARLASGDIRGYRLENGAWRIPKREYDRLRAPVLFQESAEAFVRAGKAIADALYPVVALLTITFDQAQADEEFAE